MRGTPSLRARRDAQRRQAADYADYADYADTWHLSGCDQLFAAPRFARREVTRVRDRKPRLPAHWLVIADSRDLRGPAEGRSREERHGSRSVRLSVLGVSVLDLLAGCSISSVREDM